ncbi:hypothetical protein XENTR_v10003965 [Xenopus tropicalis]|uniref:Uncharacterized protein LOC108645817 n=1 Tax=Xenopus tropicalis TaxID=8364 RepID=A0A8J1IZK6_XENTR|nr:uncharacterized protein LOC108645817 [Xenopus tropicalis]XP_031750185.1 uncharacterized protein LOC116407950 [Xenopus tropicalis]KAE8575851.1 hypothetical protein XENTR_v10003965 [Xenopus tropicalis]|eukprot:XP_017947204.1 PREDICTED: uncharacterized protein LOC108645817 [Xenopus tropicalis]
MSEDKTEDVIQFLRDRGLQEEFLSLIKNDKIDRDVVLVLDDASLAKYIPSYGDRIALFSYCKRSEAPLKRKMGLFDKLRKQLKLKKGQAEGQSHQSSSSDNEREKFSIGKNKRKHTRSIEIGWIHIEESIIKQVRAKQGGGTRKVVMGKDARKLEIMEEGKRLFFPNGKSSKGQESLFKFDVCDFQQNSLSTDVTIGCMYDTIKLPVLRFYLTTEKIKQAQCNTNATTSELINQPDLLVTESETYAEGSFAQKTLEEVQEQQSYNSDIIFQASFASDIIINSDEEITFAPITGDVDLNDTILWLEPSPINSPGEESLYVLKIHHANCMNDMIDAFCDPDILSKNLDVRRILNDNTEEAGSGSGVLRDTICHFWQEFYERCTLGTQLKVPFIRHDFTAETWKAIGRIYVKGYQDCGYLPCKLALSFTEEVLFNYVYSDVIEDFFHYVSASEKEILSAALSNFSSVEIEDLLEVLDNYKCRRKISAESFKQTLLEIAHKEIVQRPMFVIDCWREIVKPLNLSPEKLAKLYLELKPTQQKVYKLLAFPEDMTPKQKEVSNYLKRYVRELDQCTLPKFLRYCTGSDLISSSKISIHFETMTPFTRRPIVATCAMILQLADEYANFPDFRAEFNAVLDSNIWVMEFV